MNLGPYELRGELGCGAMAKVWRAWDPKLLREVAIKEPLFDGRLAEEVIAEMGARFVREGIAAARLNHPGVVAIYAAEIYDGRPVIVMELVKGMTLGEMLEAGALSPQVTLDILDQLLDAVGYAHSQGIVHRDIKPDNIFISTDGRVKLSDFGIARIEDASQTKATQMGTVLGTPGYMAPEQALGEPADKRTDLFAIGIIAHEMLTGHNPFGATANTNAASLLYKIVHEPAPALLYADAAGLSSDIRPAIQAALSKSPKDRPQDAASFKAMLHGAPAPSRSKPTAYPSSTSAIPSYAPARKVSVDTKTSVSLPQVGPKREVFWSRKEVISRLAKGEGLFGTEWVKKDSPEASISVPQIAPKPKKWLPYALVGGVGTLFVVIALIIAIPSPGASGSPSSESQSINDSSSTLATSSPTEATAQPSNNSSSALATSSATLVPANVSVGDTLRLGEVRFDAYHGGIFSDNIEWRVLALENDRVLVISENVIEVRPYHHEYTSITWEKSDLRRWLNGAFFDGLPVNARTQIGEVSNQNPDNWGTLGGNSTQDRVFLLSISEAEQYFYSDKNRQARLSLSDATMGFFAEKYGMTLKVFEEIQSGYWWWRLRSPGSYGSEFAASVNHSGSVYGVGGIVDLDSGGVRPSFWLNR